MICEGPYPNREMNICRIYYDTINRLLTKEGKDKDKEKKEK